VYDTPRDGNSAMYDTPLNGNSAMYDTPINGNSAVYNRPRNSNSAVYNTPRNGNSAVYRIVHCQMPTRQIRYRYQYLTPPCPTNKPFKNYWCQIHCGMANRRVIINYGVPYLSTPQFIIHHGVQ